MASKKQHAAIDFQGAAKITIAGGAGTSGQVLTSGGSGAMSWADTSNSSSSFSSNVTIANDYDLSIGTTNGNSGSIKLYGNSSSNRFMAWEPLASDGQFRFNGGVQNAEPYVTYFNQQGTGGHDIYVDGDVTVGGATGYKLPTADGSANQFIKTNGSGTATWATPEVRKNNTYLTLTTAAGDYYTWEHGLGMSDAIVMVRRAISGTENRATRFANESGRHLDVGHDVQVIMCDANGAVSSNHVSLHFDNYTIVDGEYMYVTIIG